jgi:uncharacterized protein
MGNHNGRKPQQLTPRPDHTGAIVYALSRLGTELSPDLTYHSHWHTEQVVLPAVSHLTQKSQIPEDIRKHIEVAAAFHDIGFIETYQGHELAGMALAEQVLPEFGFPPEIIYQIKGMILATRLPQNPQNLMEEILADADLDVLGRDDFFEQNDALYREVVAYGNLVDRLQWLEGQIKFISGHEYFTSAARNRRGFREQQNLSALEERLSQVIVSGRNR